MVEQGLGLTEMAEALGRTTTQIERKIQRLQRKGELNTAGLEPATENETSNPVASGGKTPNSVSLGDEDRTVKELLQASLQLFPRYPVACQILLTEAASKLANEEKWVTSRGLGCVRQTWRPSTTL